MHSEVLNSRTRHRHTPSETLYHSSVLNDSQYKASSNFITLTCPIDSQDYDSLVPKKGDMRNSSKKASYLDHKLQHKHYGVVEQSRTTNLKRRVTSVKRKSRGEMSCQHVILTKYEQLLKQIIDKQEMLRKLNEKIDKRRSQLEQLELQYAKKIAASKKQYITLEASLRKESEKLMDIEHKMLQFEQLYQKKKEQINRGREELQGLLQCVEKMGRQNQSRSRRIETQEKAQSEARSQLLTLQKQLQFVRQKLTQEQKSIRLTEAALFQRTKQIEIKAHEIERDFQRIARIKDEQYTKQVQLIERDKILSAYVNQLNHCISQLSMERGSLIQLKTQLGCKYQKLFEQMENRMTSAKKQSAKQQTVLQPLDINRSLSNQVYKNCPQDKKQPSMSLNLSSMGSLSGTNILVVDSPTQMLFDTRVLF